MVAGTRRRTQPGHRSRWTSLTALAAPNAQVSRFLDGFDAFVEAVRGLTPEVSPAREAISARMDEPTKQKSRSFVWRHDELDSLMLKK